LRVVFWYGLGEANYRSSPDLDRLEASLELADGIC
jgi:hypothetical protein